jgi:2-polyprenyl-6-methoxyphenol hydroxylase-like FAD-dependent oxidoreductase
MSKRRAGGWADHRRMSRNRPDVAIVGGGIAGLVTALCLDAAGVGCEVWERVPGCPELGVGINLLPPAVEVLARLGLLDELDRHGIRTSELILATRRGQHVWREPRGQAAGHAAPQLSVHRGHLHGVLQRAVRDRLGDHRLHLGVAVEPGALPDARIVLGADGIHSVVRTTIVGDGPPRWNGVLMWRGATPSPPFLDGSTMIVAGGTPAKAVVYPIGPAPRGLRLTNWAVVVRVAEDGATPPRREDWSRLAELADVQWQLGRFDIADVDLPGLVAATERIYEYPMCDRDPLPTWTHGNVTLIGDAAHPMYPMGSNGGTQAILDAEAFARHVSTTTSTADALAAYEDERRPVTSAIVAVNRAGGPERVIDLVEARAPRGFARRADVLDDDELRALLAEYGRLTLRAR